MHYSNWHIVLHIEIRSEETLEREKRLTDDLLRHLNTVHNGNIRYTLTLIPPPINRQEMNAPSPALRAKRFEQLRKLGATPFTGTLDPA